MNEHCHPLTREEVIDLLERLQDEVKDEKIAGFGIEISNVVTTTDISPLLFSACITGKHIVIHLLYGDDDG